MAKKMVLANVGQKREKKIVHDMHKAVVMWMLTEKVRKNVYGAIYK